MHALQHFLISKEKKEKEKTQLFINKEWENCVHYHMHALQHFLISKEKKEKEKAQLFINKEWEKLIPRQNLLVKIHLQWKCTSICVCQDLPIHLLLCLHCLAGTFEPKNK